VSPEELWPSLAAENEEEGDEAASFVFVYDVP